LVQFHDFIISNLDLLSFEKLLPRLSNMVNQYGIAPAAAFYIWRPILSEKIRRHEIDFSMQVQKQKLLKNLADKGSEPNEGSTSPSPSVNNEIPDSMPVDSPVAPPAPQNQPDKPNGEQKAGEYINLLNVCLMI
jgi:hypothetical protein